MARLLYETVYGLTCVCLASFGLSQVLCSGSRAAQKKGYGTGQAPRAPVHALCNEWSLKGPATGNLSDLGGKRGVSLLMKGLCLLLQL